MLWPHSAPSRISLPKIGNFVGGNEELAHDESRQVEIIGIATSKRAYIIAILTWNGLYIYRPNPLCPVAVFIRSKKSLTAHGEHKSLFIRSDGLVIGVTTDSGVIIMYQITPPNALAEVCTFGRSFSIGEGGLTDAFPGPGEAVGVREIKIRYWMLIKVDSGISRVVPLDDHIMVITKQPVALQLVKWTQQKQFQPLQDANSLTNGNQTTFSLLLSKLDWLPQGGSTNSLRHIATSKAMSLMSLTFESGKVFSATLNEAKIGPGEKFFDGHLLHDKTDAIALISSINARFSTVAVGCQDGAIYLYNIQDYTGSAALIRVLRSPASSCGPVQTLEWSQDGNALFSGYAAGWAQFSIYGMLTASSFLSNEDHIKTESWLGGIRQCAWAQSGDHLYMIPNDGGALWELSMMKWNMASSFSDNNLQRPILFNNNKMMIYRGHEQSDITTIDRDALLWLNVNFPASYIAEHWPIRYLSSSEDGRYVAVAGARGLTHYSVYSGRWKMFAEDYMDHEFSVRGGMVWYEHLLILAVTTDQYVEELRVYSRNLELSPQNMLFSTELPTQIFKLSILNSLLLVYTQSNVLYFYDINDTADGVSLDLRSKVAFNGIIHSPARVRGLNCLQKPGSGHETKSMEVSILLLADGMLVLLEPTVLQTGGATGGSTGEATPRITYTKRILHHHIEYYTITQGTKSIQTILWGFDGKDLLVWLGDVHRPETQYSVVSVETYPLAVLLGKGIAIGIEADAVLPREAIFTYFKSWTTTQLFVPYLLEAYLQMGQKNKALEVATEYRKLKYFGHILEMLLYRILDYQVDHPDLLLEGEEPGDHEPLLNRAVDLVSQFPQMLDVILGCTRKTEVTYWPALFNIIGSPQQLFERCLAIGNLDTAAGYLLVLHSLEQYEQRPDNTVRLLKSAYETGEWELCKDLARFLTAIDPSFKTLKEGLQVIGLDIEAGI